MAIKDLVEALYPLNRQINSDGMDEALRLIGKAMPAESFYTIEEFQSGSKAWTWTIPKRWVCHGAYITRTQNGKYHETTVFGDDTLGVVAYSIPIETDLTWNELQPHLHFSDARPDAVPWMYSYYTPDWGFCVTKAFYDKLPHDARYRVVIRSEFLDEPGMKVATAMLGKSILEGSYRDVDGTWKPCAFPRHQLLISTHVCHPHQANDDAAGVAVAVEVANRLARHPLPDDALAVRFLFGPETIGSVAWLSRHEDKIPHIVGGIFVEMAGNSNRIQFNRTWQSDTTLDKIAIKVCRPTWRKWWRAEYGTVPTNALARNIGVYGEAPRNDEKVINGPGVDIPCISLSRWPYPEYHTSDDTPDIIHEDKLVEMADVVEEIVRIRATDYTPRRTFRGYLNMRGYGLWVDWRKDWNLHQAIEKITHLCDGELSVFEISERVGLGYWETRDWLDKLIEKGLVVKA